MDAEQVARRQQWLARRAFQRQQDKALAGDNDAAAAIREDWRPIEQFQKEGPDVGEREEIESEKLQRIN